MKIYKINLGAGGITTLAISKQGVSIDNEWATRQEVAQYIREARIQGFYILRVA